MLFMFKDANDGLYGEVFDIDNVVHEAIIMACVCFFYFLFLSWVLFYDGVFV